MKNRLFDDNDRWTPEAIQIGIEMCEALRPFFEDAKKKNISFRDLEIVGNAAVSDIMLDFVLDAAGK